MYVVDYGEVFTDFTHARAVLHRAEIRRDLGDHPQRVLGDGRRSGTARPASPLAASRPTADSEGSESCYCGCCSDSLAATVKSNNLVKMDVEPRRVSTMRGGSESTS